MSDVNIADEDLEKVRAAVRLGLSDAKLMTKNSILRFEDTAIFNFRGWVIPMAISKPVQLLIEILEAGSEGCHNNELCRLIGCKSYSPEVVSHEEVDPREIGEQGAMGVSSGRKIKESYTNDELIRMKKVVGALEVEQEDAAVRVAELRKRISKAESALDEFREICDQIEKNDLDLELLTTALERQIEKRFPSESERQRASRNELVRLGLDAIQEMAALNREQAGDDTVKEYRKLLRIWFRRRCPKALIIYVDVEYTSSVKRYVNRVINQGEKDRRIPRAFLDHLRQAISHEGDMTYCYSDEEWITD